MSSTSLSARNKRRASAHGAPDPRISSRERESIPIPRTETFVALQMFIDNWRWAGVPFFLRTGKALPKRASEIAVQFKEVPPILFNANARQPRPERPGAPHPAGRRALRSASTQGAGPRAQLPVKMDFQYSDVFGARRPRPTSGCSST